MNKFKYHFLGALVFMGTIVFTYIGYAIWTDIPTQQTGETMTADIWNNMVTSVNGMAGTVNTLIYTIDSISTKLSGTYTSGKMCISDSAGKIQCNTDIPSGAVGGLPQNSQTFTANGTFTVPAGVTKLMVYGCGGGAGGGAAGKKFNSGPSGAGGGSSGGSTSILTVTPGQNISVTIGAGGAGAILSASISVVVNGGDGGNTSFGSIVFNGGGGGGGGKTDSYSGKGGAGGRNGGSGSNGNGELGGNGAGGCEGEGGIGGVSGASGTRGTGYGSGGGGGGANTGNGGAGTSGKVIVYW